MNNSYWNNNGKFQAASEALAKLVPASGEVTAANSKALEKFRKASNCYYDLYNNGLCNRRKEFRKVFKIASSNFETTRFSWNSSAGRTEKYKDMNFDAIMPVVEPVMDAIIEAAAKEQGIALSYLPTTL